MQGGQGPGRGIYIARRIAVVPIFLILLILLVPRACDALLGTREEQSSEAPETANVTEEEATPVQEEITEREEVAVSGAEEEEEEEEATSEEAREVEGVGAANIE